MTDKEIVNKAIKVLNHLKISYDINSQPTICRYDKLPSIISEMLEEVNKNQFFVSFEFTLPGGMQNHISVYFENNSYKTIAVMTKYRKYKVPEGFE